MKKSLNSALWPFLSLMLLLFPSWTARAHGGNQSFVFLKGQVDRLTLQVHFNQEDIRQQIQTDGLCAQNADLGLCASKYAQKHIQVWLNGSSDPLRFEYTGFTTSKGMIYLNFECKAVVKDIQSVTLFNGCFQGFKRQGEDHHHEYEHYCTVEINQTQVTYQLNHQRKTVTTPILPQP